MSLKVNLLNVVDSAMELAKETEQTIEVRSAIVKLQQARNAIMQFPDEGAKLPAQAVNGQENASENKPVKESPVPVQAPGLVDNDNTSEEGVVTPPVE